MSLETAVTAVLDVTTGEDGLAVVPEGIDPEDGMPLCQPLNEWPGSKWGHFAEEAGSPAEESIAPKLTPDQEALVTRYFDRVERIAQRVIHDINDLDDARGDGFYGLVTAAIRYDERKKHPNATTGVKYFDDYIRGEVMHGLRAKYGRSKNGGVAPVKPGVMAGTALSLEAPASGADELFVLEEVLPSSVRQEQVDLSLDIQEVLETVDELDREIFLRHVVGGQEVREAGEATGVSIATVSRGSHRIAKVLRKSLWNHRDSY